MSCYGVQRHPHGDPWMCDTCCLQHQPQGPLLSQPPACSLCPCIGGVMKPTTEGGWCHLLCASWTPGVTVGDDDRWVGSRQWGPVEVASNLRADFPKCSRQCPFA